ncbi:hypothetical protein RhiirA5_346204 [Rhizophagus irregularis]|nr:hypothetical protein RhiirA5_360804 [Rhizophagus irregularis]PKC05884.1 hypothetical protein RhiirA5_360811 [Rhizophagus irregularis]PKC17505.1 hypothetical protein RhiirA5_346204 [Rhizophagus irregularis]
MNHYSPGSSEFYDEFLDSPSHTPTSSNQWGVWSPNQEDSPPSYSTLNNDNDLFGSIDNVQVTPLWEAEDDPPLNTSNSRNSRNSRNSHRSSSPNLVDDFPLWVDSQVDPLWTPPNRNTSSRNTSTRNTTSRKFSPPATPRSNSPSDEEEIHCPRCTFFIRPNKTSCEMCGTNITRQEPKRSHNKSSSKPKSTITSYRDLYEEDEDEDEEEEEDEDEDPFADPTPRRNNRSSYSSRDNYRNSSSSKSRNSDDYDDYIFDNNEYSQSRNQSSSRNRRSSDNRSSLYQSPTPPSDELWVDEDENYFESIPPRRSTRQRAPPKPYTPPSFFKDTESRPNRNVQKPPTPPLKEKQEKQITCPACNFDNHLSMTHCEICYTQLNKTPEQDNKKNPNFNRIEQTRAKKACPNCSYYNDATSVQCEMCYRPMETIRKSIFTLPSFFSHDVNMTQCPNCTFMNHHTMAQCEMCRGELPGSNLKQQQQQYQQFVENMPGPITKLIKLPVDDHDYMTVQQHFKTGVQNSTILAIFRVIMPERIIKAHEAYQKQLAGNNPVAKVTHRMYHGSHVACDAKRYYGPSAWNYCNAADCGLCGIAQNGNICARSKYGGRMWFASSSATSLGYCRNDPIKAMFVQEIISQTGGDVIIVDKEAATLVKFLIIFQ